MMFLALPLLASMAIDTLPGRFLRATWVGPEGRRDYRLYIPSSHDPTRPAPLIVALHGCTQDGADLAAGTRLNALAERDTVLVVYPEQPADAHPSKCWNWYLPGHRRRDRGEPALIAALTRAVQKEHGGDPARTWLLGISAGAALASTVAALHPEVYAALALHSGLAFGAADSAERALVVMRTGAGDPVALGDAAFAAMGERSAVMPTIVFHGAADAVVAPRNGEEAAAQWLRTNARVLRADAFSSLTTSGTAPDGRRYTRTVHVAGGDPLVELWLVEGLGHAWSGGDPAGTFTDAGGPSASEAMVRFFREAGRR